MSTLKNRSALVLAGGGALGGFAIGAIETMLEAGKKFDSFYGVSTGALIGAMMAQDEFDKVFDEYYNVSPARIMRGNMSIPSIIWALVRGQKSVTSNAPLLARAYEMLDVRKIVHPFACGVVDLNTGNYQKIQFLGGSSKFDYAETVVASTSIPVVWSPYVADSSRLLVDGGIRNNAPLGDAIADEPKDITVVLCSPLAMSNKMDAGKDIKTIVARTFEILMSEILINDLHTFLLVNEICLNLPNRELVVGDKTYKYIPIKIVQPNVDLGDPLDFTTSVVRKHILAGQRTAN